MTPEVKAAVERLAPFKSDGHHESLDKIPEVIDAAMVIRDAYLSMHYGDTDPVTFTEADRPMIERLEASHQEAAGPGHGIYVASKTEHAPMWKELRAQGWPIISTWIDEAGPGESACLADLWIRCVREASSCERLVLYPGLADGVLKGALVEVGAALASGRKVFIVGADHPCVGSFINHPLVTVVESVEAALGVKGGGA